MTTEGLPGLSTTEALHTLYNEILSLRNHIKDKHIQQYFTIFLFHVLFSISNIIIIHF